MEVKLKVEVLQHTPEPEKLISAAAKLCYSKSGIEKLMEGLDNDSVDKFIAKLMDMGHESPIEHVSFTFGIEGVSRSLTHQLVRHRVASYSQKSQRYVSEAQFEYIIPPQIAEDERARHLYIKAMEKDQAIYDEITGILKEKRYIEYLNNGDNENTAKNKAEKTAIEDARYVLPNGCETKIIATMNARELLHFFNHRCCERAQWEIRELATQMLKLVREAAPLIFKNAGPNCVKGPCPEGPMTCGKIKDIREKFNNL